MTTEVEMTQQASQAAQPMAITIPNKLIQQQRASNRVMRWNLLWFILVCLIFVPLPLWLYPVTCFGGFIVISSVTAWSCLVLFMCAVHATITMLKLTMRKRANASQVADATVRICGQYSLNRFSNKAQSFSGITSRNQQRRSYGAYGSV